MIFDKVETALDNVVPVIWSWSNDKLVSVFVKTFDRAPGYPLVSLRRLINLQAVGGVKARYFNKSKIYKLTIMLIWIRNDSIKIYLLYCVICIKMFRSAVIRI